VAFYLVLQPALSDWHEIAAWVIQALTPVSCFVISFYYNDLYDLRVVRHFGAFSVRLPQALGVSFILLAVCYSVFPWLGIDVNPFSSLMWSLGIFLAIVLPLRGLLYGVMRLRTFSEHVLILGTSPLAWAIAQEIEDAPHLGYDIVGLIDDGGKPPAGNTVTHIPFGSLERLNAILNDMQPDRIIVALRERRGRLPIQGLLNARMSGIMVEDGVEVHERLTGKLAIESLNPSFLFFSKDFKKLPLQMALRRAASLAVALLGLIVATPLMAIIMIAIWLDSGSPIFFVQDRAGVKGRPFKLVKFRTMYPATAPEEQGSIWNRDINSRITRIGRMLRKLRLDELPQFINVLKGDMNLVGPRPEMVGNVETMIEQIPYYSLRMEVRPGITGWAQVKHGYSVSQEDVTEKMRYDLYYVKHMSLWFDLRILIDTVKIVLFGHEREIEVIEVEAAVGPLAPKKTSVAAKEVLEQKTA
jgi:exopolysaccharide biosynthesis polyprenyl glycosylphosphotransferase